jgi:hypothetical protein
VARLESALGPDSTGTMRTLVDLYSDLVRHAAT